MKKAIATLGLFSMMMILTSFTTNDDGGQVLDKGRKSDYYGTGGQSIMSLQKMDAPDGGQVIDKGKKKDDEYDGGNGQVIDKGRKKDDAYYGGNGQVIDKGRKQD